MNAASSSSAAAPRPRAGKRLPLYREIVGVLEQRMRSGALAVGSQAPSEAALIAEFAVSSTTARRCLNELAQRGLVQRIQGKGTFVAPHATLTDRAPVGVFYHELVNLSNTFTAQCLRGLSFAGKTHEIRPVLLDWGLVRDSAGPAHALSDLVDRHELQGVLVISPAPLSWFERVLDRGLPIVSINFRYQDSRIASVLVDNTPGERWLIEQIEQCGHQRAVIIRQTFANELLEGVQMIPSFSPDPEPQFQWRVETYPYWDQTHQLEKLVARHLARADRPTLFWARSYEAALELRHLIRQHGLSVPEDVSLVFAGVPPAPTDIHGIITPIAEMAATATGVLAGMIGGAPPQRLVTPLEPGYTVGRTLGPAPNAQTSRHR